MLHETLPVTEVFRVLGVYRYGQRRDRRLIGGLCHGPIEIAIVCKEKVTQSCAYTSISLSLYQQRDTDKFRTCLNQLPLTHQVTCTAVFEPTVSNPLLIT